MIKSQEVSEPDSCFNKARDDEMLFVLLGRDPAAAVAIRAWVIARIALGENAVGDRKTEEALRCAGSMGAGRLTFLPATELLFSALFEDVQITAYSDAIKKGWWDGDDHNKGEKIALMHSELSEMLEGARHGNPPSEHIPAFSAEEEEAADVVIRLMDYGGKWPMRLGQAIIAKLAFNRTRAHKHGGKAF